MIAKEDIFCARCSANLGRENSRLKYCIPCRKEVTKEVKIKSYLLNKQEPKIRVKKFDITKLSREEKKSGTWKELVII